MVEKKIVLPFHGVDPNDAGIVVTLILREQESETGLDYQVAEGDIAACTITSSLKEVCPVCNESECYFSCDLSQGGPPEIPESTESEEDVDNRKRYNAAIDGIESLILAHACEGIDIENSDYQIGIDTAIQACGQNFS